jgi:hypothetical protein
LYTVPGRRSRSWRAPNAEAWAAKTSAQQHSPESFAAYKDAQQLFVLGVMGYAGAWRRSGLKGARLETFIADARAALHRSLLAARDQHGRKLVMASGATNIGVLELAYDLCTQLGILAMGITSGRALAYSLGEMQYVVPVGHKFGDESEDFVTLCDAFVVLGGGPQSLHEAELALARGKDVEVIAGFGGAADSLATRTIDGLTVVAGRPPSMSR